MNNAEKLTKRGLDISVSLLLLLLLLPFMLVVVLLVRCKLGAPIFFSQPRAGKDGRQFNMIKFRSMLDDRDHEGRLISENDRLTGFGKALRASSIDELPTLWMVVKGDLSLVGPRPLLVQYLPLYNAHQQRRHEVKSGITGWTQVNGRNALSWEDKFDSDVWYVDNQSLLLDIKILLLTVVKVVRREGIDSLEHGITMPFIGSSKPESESESEREKGTGTGTGTGTGKVIDKGIGIKHSLSDSSPWLENVGQPPPDCRE